MENRIVVIVLNYNDYETTKKFVQRVEKFSNIYKIVVVDNASTDNSYQELLKQKNDKVDVISSNQNGGYAYGNNIGMKYATDQYQPELFIISNPDIIFEEELINKMKQLYNSRTDVGQVAAMMKSLQGKKEYIAWKQLAYIDCIIEMSILLKKIFKNRLMYSETMFEKEIIPVDVVSGAFFMIKSETMQSVDYFDEQTFLYCEENILAYKLKKAGYQNLLLTKEEYVHDHGKTIRKNIKSVLRLYDYLIEGLYIYVTQYLKVGIIKRLIFKIMKIPCMLEKICYNVVKKQRSKK